MPPRRKIHLEYDPGAITEDVHDVRGAPITDALATLYRASMIDPEVMLEVTRLARRGYRIPAIAKKIGVGPRTLESWVARGSQKRHDIDDWVDRRMMLPAHLSHEQLAAEIGEPPREDDLLALYDAFARAEADAECELVDVIVEDAITNRNTSSAKWLLNSRHGWNSGKGGEGQAAQSTAVLDAGVLDALAAKLDEYEQKQRALNVSSTTSTATT